MAINAGIPLTVQPVQPPDQMNMLAKVLAIKDAQQNQQVNALKMQEYQNGIEQRNRLQGLLGRQYDKPEAREEALLRGGFVKEAADLTKNRVDAAKVQADTEKNRIDAAHKRVDSWGSVMGYVRQNPSLENATAAVQHLVQLGVMPAEMAQGALAQVQANPTPQGIAQFADLGFRAALGAKEQLAKITTNNIGGQTITQAADPVTGRTQVTGAVQNTQSPDAVLSAQTSEANNRRSVAAQYDLNRATREAAATQAQATRDAASIKDRRDTEMKLADDYRAQSKNFKEVSDAYKTIETSLKHATTSPAATLAGATKFMKLLDPGSVVRESELGMALAATGVFDRAMNYVNVLQRGKVLTPQQTADFQNIAAQIYQAAAQQQKLVDANYERQAKQYQLRPDLIIQDLGQNKPVNTTRGGGREASGKVDEGPSVFDQADAILRGGR